MTANVIIHKDPFRPALNMETLEVNHGLTILETLVNLDYCTPLENSIRRNGAFVVLLNGVAVLQKDWNLVLCENDVIQITRLPKGGGGGSNIGNILAAVIIAVAAYFTMGLSLYASVAVGVGAYVGLSLLTGPIPTPSQTNGQTGENASSTYSLSAQGNIARLLQAMPRIYGRVKATPDLAANPYSEYEGNQQYLYQLFCVSLGSVEIERIDFDDTNINDFPDAQYQIIGPNQAVTLFPDNVVSSDAVSNGPTMLAPNEPNYTVIGPYTAVPSGKKAKYLAVDILLARGLGLINDEGTTVNRSVTVQFEYRTIDDNGNPTGNWEILTNQTVTLATSTAQTLTFKVEIPTEGRFQVQGYRTSPSALDNRTFDSVQWVGLRGYLTSTYTYGNCTLLAVKARATNLLNNTTARRLTVWAKGLVQKWDPVNGWGALTFSDSPAWIASDILRNEDYGRGFATSRFNVAKLYQLADTWAARGDTFNGVFDSTSQLWEALGKVLRVGRAVPVYYAGVIDFIRDQPQTIPTAHFQPANIISGSFETTYQFFDVDTPDHVVIQYRDGATWQPAEVTCALPGETALNPSTIELFGITNRDQAYREGMSLAAGNRDRRRIIRFSTLTEGLVLKYNGLIRISHDVPQWGFSGRVLSFDAATGRLRTSELIPFDPSVTNVIAFRKKDGSENGPFTMTPDPQADDNNRVFGCIVGGTLAQRQAIYISDGVLEDNTFYQCGPTERSGLKALVKSVKPDQDGKVSVECFNYAESVYSAENGGVVPPPGPESSLPGTPAAPIVDKVDVVYTVVVGQQNIIATPAKGAIYYEFQALKSDSNTWVLLGTQESPIMSVGLSPGQWSVRVRGVGRSPGPWATWTGTIEATSLPTATLDTFTAVSQLFAISLNWSFSAASVTLAKEIEVYAGLTNVLGNATRLFKLPYPANAYMLYGLEPGERRYFWARVIDTADRVGAWFNNSQPITQIAVNDPSLLLTALGNAITESQLSQELAEKINEPNVDLTPVYAAITAEQEARINADGGLATRIDGTVAVANNAWAATQTNATSIAKTNGDLSAMYTIKTQVTSNGIPYMASIGVGVDNTGGIITSQILFRADTFAMINPNSGAYAAPFIVKGNNTYIAAAFIETATITNAIIGQTISSTAQTNWGGPVMTQDFAGGQSIYRHPTMANTYTIVNQNGIQVVISGVLRFRAGTW